MLIYHASIKGLVESAKLVMGFPGDAYVKMSYDELVALLTSRGVNFKLLKDGGLEIDSVGMFPSFSRVSVLHLDRLVEGNLEMFPTQNFGGWLVMSRDEHLLHDISDEVLDFIRVQMPIWRPKLAEDLVQLPIPEWVFPAGEGEVLVQSIVLFQSQANKIWKEFTSQNPFSR